MYTYIHMCVFMHIYIYTHVYVNIRLATNGFKYKPSLPFFFSFLGLFLPSFARCPFIFFLIFFLVLFT